MILEPVAPNKLREHWPRVKEGLDEIQRKAPDSGWIAEDVYHAIRAGHAFLVLIADKGFLVHQILAGDDGRGLLFIWIIHGDLIEVKAELESELEAFGRSINVARIRWGSPRRWDAFGWGKLIGYVYEVEL